MTFEIKKILKDRYGTQGSLAYDELLTEIGWHYLPTLEAIAAEALVGRGISHPKKILDLGMGTGNTSMALLRKLPRNQKIELFGLDASEAMLDQAERKFQALPHVHFRRIVGQLQSVGKLLEHHDFDLIISNIAIHHLTLEEKEALFRDCSTLLNSKGAIVIGDRMPPESHQEHQDFHRVWAEPLGKLFKSDERPSSHSLAIALQKAFDDDFDQPSTLEDHIRIFNSIFFQPRVPFQSFGVCVISGMKKNELAHEHPAQLYC
jgi:ubiquinone/menaquinone biosynthesis C-methylase UbiE